MTARTGASSTIPEEGPARPSASAEESVLHGAWLDGRTLICATTWRGPRSRQPVRGVLRGPQAATALVANALPWPEEAGRPAGSLLVLSLDEVVRAAAPLGALILEADRRQVHFGPDNLASVVVGLQALLREHLTARSARTREAAMQLLIQASGDQEADPARAVNLRAVRDAVRERRIPSVVAADVPQALYVESIYRIDEAGFYVRGWSRDTAAETMSITAVSPDGARIEIGDKVYRYPRPDLDEFYPTPLGGGAKAGFLAFFRTPVASTLADGWVFEMENNAGSAVEFAAPGVDDDTRITRDTILADLYHESPGGADLIRDHIHPAVSGLQQRRNEGIGLTRVEQYGSPPASPDVSVLVPLYGRIDFLEQQLAQFVHDPAMREVDLVYLLDSPELGEPLLQLAAWMESLYGIPFRVALADRNGGFAAANNLAASIARGRLLLLMNSDILPAQPGWVSALARAHDAIPNVGVAAPKLLYEDGSLQHAGLYFHFERFAGTWNNEHYFKGLHGSLPAAQQMRQVPAVTAACAMISADLYREVGGLQGKYIQGDYEDSDLCLRLYERGLGAWYVPDVTLYHLEGQSYPSALRQLTGRYNQWLHSQAWGELIPRVMEELRTDSTRAPAAPVRIRATPAPMTRSRTAAARKARASR